VERVGEWEEEKRRGEKRGERDEKKDKDSKRGAKGVNVRETNPIRGGNGKKTDIQSKKRSWISEEWGKNRGLGGVFRGEEVDTHAIRFECKTTGERPPPGQHWPWQTAKGKIPP
jgi:hypothetical protein